MSYGGFEYNNQGGGYDMGGGGYGGMNPMDDVDMNAGGFDSMNGGSGGAGSAEKKTFKMKSILPVSIKMINTSGRDQGNIQIDNTNPEMVRIFGTIESMEQLATSVEYTINDGTGKIQAKKWKEQKEQGDPTEIPCVEGSFVEMVGNLKEFNESLSLQVFAVNIVEDWNALTHHLLDIILTHNFNTKGPIPGSEAAAAVAKPTGGYNMGMGGGAMAMSPAGYGGGMRAQGGGDAGLDDQLLKAIKATSGSEEGTTVDQTFDYMVKAGANVTRDKVSRMVDNLTNDGVLYGTIDELHFKSCED